MKGDILQDFKSLILSLENNYALVGLPFRGSQETKTSTTTLRNLGISLIGKDVSKKTPFDRVGKALFKCYWPILVPPHSKVLTSGSRCLI